MSDITVWHLNYDMQKQSYREISLKSVLKNSYKKTPVLQSLFKKSCRLELYTGVSFFYRTPPVAGSIHATKTVLGKLPPGRLHPGKLPPP